jgi:hypothetical protein
MTTSEQGAMAAGHVYFTAVNGGHHQINKQEELPPLLKEIFMGLVQRRKTGCNKWPGIIG